MSSTTVLSKKKEERLHVSARPAMIRKKRSPRNNCSSNRIRIMFLNRLGINDDGNDLCHETEEKIPQHLKKKERLPSRGSLLGKVKIRKEPLKFNNDISSPSFKFSPLSWLPHLFCDFHQEVSSSSKEQKEECKDEKQLTLSSSLSTISTCDESFINNANDKNNKGRRSITFHDEVEVVPIPMRSEYSKRIRHRLWTGINELHYNAQRNMMEFSSEGWDWRTVVDDENLFLYDTLTGEFIHPVHFNEISD